jgi:hypothetical protein
MSGGEKKKKKRKERGRKKGGKGLTSTAIVTRILSLCIATGQIAINENSNST